MREDESIILVIKSSREYLKCQKESLKHFQRGKEISFVNSMDCSTVFLSNHNDVLSSSQDSQVICIKVLHQFFIFKSSLYSPINNKHRKQFGQQWLCTTYNNQECSHYSIVHFHIIFKMSGVIERINDYILSGSKSLKGPTMAALIS